MENEQQDPGGSDDMQVAELEQKSEIKQTDKPVQQATVHSKFDEQEYKRWSDNLTKSRSKSK